MAGTEQRSRYIEQVIVAVLQQSRSTKPEDFQDPEIYRRKGEHQATA
jgi:hypothetical protein